MKCSCGSGLPKYELYDGYGIFLACACAKCEAAVLSKFRSDIMDCYSCDESIDGEDY